jgi:hypothetical protein
VLDSLSSLPLRQPQPLPRMANASLIAVTLQPCGISHSRIYRVARRPLRKLISNMKVERCATTQHYAIFNIGIDNELAQKSTQYWFGQVECEVRRKVVRGSTVQVPETTGVFHNRVPVQPWDRVSRSLPRCLQEGFDHQREVSLQNAWRGGIFLP